jgi:hypothetical protein
MRLQISVTRFFQPSKSDLQKLPLGEHYIVSLHQDKFGSPISLIRHCQSSSSEVRDRQRLAHRNPTMAAMRGAVDDKLMADIVADNPGQRPRPRWP